MAGVVVAGATGAGAVSGLTAVAGAVVPPGIWSPAVAGAVAGKLVRSSTLPVLVGRKLPK